MSRSVYAERYADLTSAFGRLRPGQDLTVASGLKLWAVVGRSLVLRGVASGRVACAPLQPAGRVATLRAELHGPQLGGRVALRQSAAGSGLLSQLYHVTPARRDSLHRWALLRGDCERGEPVPSPVEGPLAAGRAPGVLTGRTFVSWNGMLDGALSIVIYGDKDTASIAACAPLRPIEPRQAVANWTDLGGTVLLRQDSPYDATLVTVQFRREAVRKAYSYGIDELPTISRGEIGVMCPNVRGVIYNPLGVSADRVPSPGEGSFEQYAVGDLSGKYGPLGENSAVEFVQVHDPYLTLFGPYSVVGRSAVVFRPDGVPLACANIALEGVKLLTAVATFDTPVQGQAIFQQAMGQSDVWMYVELSHPEPGGETYGHTWSVHERLVRTGSRLSSAWCADAGSVYNPYNVTTTAGYECQCSALAPERCVAGDLSGRLDTLDIPPFSSGRLAQYMFTDPGIELSQLLERSLVLGGPDFSDTPLACTNILAHN
ncbi:hypothetical protein LAZ67_9000004 [Cordylochernes scorpioides]|uniref:Sporulation stage II protein D amidase enhancer LytB N-terminal domain-containing protein n=1 Tax=Cordylochernes scorpioides TaxID=51811 RepID=A0ABY6KS37_9ARAC|nr:hypothetical protein LAZ67_9000004 [Cordylochernes scorpioides]